MEIEKILEYINSLVTLPEEEFYKKLILNYKNLGINSLKLKEELQIFKNQIPLVFKICLLINGQHDLIPEVLYKLPSETYKLFIETHNLKSEVVNRLPDIKESVKKELHFLLSQRSAVVAIISGEQPTPFLKARAKCGEKVQIITIGKTKIIKCDCEEKKDCPFWGVVIE